MKYFKNKNGEIFAYETQDEAVQFGSNDLVKMSEQEVYDHLHPQPTVEQLEADERTWRNKELDRADIELNKVQDSDPKAIGTVAQWREYRKALRSYPESEGFPNKDKRPVAPDA